MNVQTKAVIDVGTNSIKLLVARTDSARVDSLVECKASRNVRLGRGFYKHQELQAGVMRRAAGAIRELSVRASRYEPVSVRAVATSAVRDASNRDEFIALVRQTTGLDLEVLPGKTEAEWVFRGVTSDPSVSAQKLLVLGFGGGSTAAAVSDSKGIRCRTFDLGAVRLIETLRLGALFNANDRARCDIYLSQVFSELIVPQINSLLPADRKEFTLVATGGAATALANLKIRTRNLSCADEHSWWLTDKEISWITRRLRHLSPNERKAVPGLPVAKHDVILPAIAILEAAMKHLGFRRMRVTHRGCATARCSKLIPRT
jgi:exopolyphosphatase/guanosine-5'-triphosphate,3'-diphosphate pyrophosphatase